MRLVPRLALASTLVLVLAACQTVLSESRVAPGDEVRVSASYDEFDDRCVEGEPVDIYLDDDDDPVASGVADEDGNFDIPFSAPQEPGSYEVAAECAFPVIIIILDAGVSEDEVRPAQEEPSLDRRFLAPANLIVEPVLTMAAEPTLLDPAQEFTVTGNFCVSESETSDPPVVTVSFEGTDETVVAEEPQPFDGEWMVDFTAPDEAGTYDVTASCVYDDEPGEDPINGEGPLTVASDGVSAAAASEPQPYPVVQVTVVDEAPTTTAPAPPPAPAPAPAPTTTTVPAAPAPPQEAPRAAPAVAQPTFVG
jgi:hypothetical protein